jgi:hypothetical protein
MLPSLRATRLEFGVAAQRRQRRSQQAAETHGRGQPQLTLGLVAQAHQGLFGRARRRHHGGATGVVALAGLRQREAPRRAVQQGQAQRLLQLAQVLAHGRGRHAQAARRRRQRAGRHHLGKNGHALELVQGFVAH